MPSLDSKASKRPAAGPNKLLIAAIVLAVLVGGGAALARVAGDANQESQPAAQPATPTAEHVEEAADDIEDLKEHAGTALTDQQGVKALVDGLELDDEGPQVTVDAGNHAIAISYANAAPDSGNSDDDPSLDRDILYNAAACFTCLEDLQQLTITIPGGETYTFRRGELEQALGGSLNAATMLKKDAWAEFLRKLDTQNLASSVVGLATDAGRSIAGQSVGGAAGSSDAAKSGQPQDDGNARQ